LYPLGENYKQDTQILTKCPKEFPARIMQGCRRASLIALLRVHDLSDDDIRCINKYVFLPPKDEEELKFEVLDKRPTLAPFDSIDISHLDLEDLIYDEDNGKFLVLEEND